MQSFDVVIVGAGAAGLFCAGVAGQLGLKVLVLDHSEKVAEKIRISGGGRANFTNVDVTAANFLSENPRFAKSALSRFTPADFVALVKKHGIAFHEKTDRKFNRMRPSMARVLGLETRSAKEG